MQYLAQVEFGSVFQSPFGVTNGLTIGDILTFLLNNAPTVAGVMLLVGIMAAGIAVIASSGKNNPQGAEKARLTATWAFIGFVVIFTAYWIVRILELMLGVDFATSPVL